MLFNSAEFLLFFFISVSVYFLLPYQGRPLWLLLASLYFYQSWNPLYLILLLACVLNHYTAGLFIEKVPTRTSKKLVLALSITVSLGMLFIFKYFNFFSSAMGFSLARILLPLGISFYTFKGVSYVMDVHRGKLKAEKNLGIFALYMSFFPAIMAGPIDRAVSLIPQLIKRQDFSFTVVVSGLRLMVWGFFLKLVLADRLAILVNQIYDHPTHYEGLPLILATYFFTFQIYFDFAGYSMIAIGCAKVLGIDLMNNFQRPYAAVSLGDFWKRWHISLTSWFRDYLYIPLGGNQASLERALFNVMIVFCLSGLWHGANWTFILWGFCHGFFYCVERITKSKIGFSLPAAVKNLIIFHFVLFTWILFRSNSLSDCGYILTHFFHLQDTKAFISQLSGIGQAEAVLGLSKKEILMSIAAIGAVLWTEKNMGNLDFNTWISSKGPVLRWFFYYVLIGGIFLWGVFNSQEFIYFKY